MSEIGDIYGRYHNALDHSLDDYTTERRNALEALRSLYEPVFQNLIRRYQWMHDRESPQWERVLETLRDRYGAGSETITFAAIDGTCGKEMLSEMLVFYGASYAQQGQLVVDPRSHRIEYRRWSPSEDTSLVAYLPIPLARLEMNSDDEWLYRADDSERATASVAHTSLMQLAEVYLAYRRVHEDSPPRVILLDHSLSSMLLSNDVMHLVAPYRPDRQTLGWIGAQIDIWGRPFEISDALVAHAHPMNRALNVPSARANVLAARLLAEITDFWSIGETNERDAGRAINLSTLAAGGWFSGDESRLRNRIEQMPPSTEEHKYGAFRLSGDHIEPVNQLSDGTPRTLRERWIELDRLFDRLCRDLFRERRVEALQLRYPEGYGRRGPRWMDTNDLKFLINLGLRLLIENCWRRRILLLGIAKDSASRFFSRNFLAVMQQTGQIHIPSSAEPAGSDRLVCEMMPLVDETLSQPWSTIEFDSIFMTLRVMLDEQSRRVIGGVQGDVLMPSDGLFARSLVQMFLRQRTDKDSPLMGHALFLDRLCDPLMDASRRGQQIRTRDSTVNPIYSTSADADNLGQTVAMLVAYLLTTNCFPEAIGQPDPLHRADQGAKALGNRINELIQQSVARLRNNPLAWSFRDTRSQAGR
jgi:hypothetical protein